MIITMTTDFGNRDGYVAAMKGVVYSRAPRATVVDISHNIPPFDVQAGSFVLAQAARFFPPETIHLGVVDPRVGSERRGLLIVSRRQMFVGPDNGLFTPFLDHQAQVFALTNPNLWLPHASNTFHGRDLFAPTAVHLAEGLAPEDVGPEVTDPVRLPAWNVRRDGDSLIGAVVHIDRFGNAITGLPAAFLNELGEGPFVVELAGQESIPLLSVYSDTRPGEALALIASCGMVEVAVREGNGASYLNVQRGDVVRIKPAR